MNEKNKQMVEEWFESGWYPAISAAAERLTALCPEVEFLQIKSKFGSLRFYYRLPEKVGPGVPMLAEEIVVWATGWVEGYESRYQEIRDLKTALENVAEDHESNVRELRQRELHHFETEQENASLRERVEELQDSIRSLEAGADEY